MADRGPEQRSSVSGRRGPRPTGAGSPRRSAGRIPASQDPDVDDDARSGRFSPAALIAFAAIAVAVCLLLWLMFGNRPRAQPVPAESPTADEVPSLPPVPPAATLNHPPKAVVRIRQDPNDPARLEYSALFSEDSDPGDEDRLVASWNFGDGTTGSASEGVHQYAKPGSFTINLTVRDPHGATASATAQAVVPESTVPTLAVVARTNQVPGLECRRISAQIDNFAAFSTLLPTAEVITAPDISRDVRPRVDQYGLRFTGFLNIPTAGKWRLTITSDDGSRLTLGGRELTIMDRAQGATPAWAVVDCAAGLVPIEVDYYQGGGLQELYLEWWGPGQPTQRIPSSAYFRAP